jgi:DNA mismatch repair protein MutS
LVAGGASRSYGIEVGRLAGLPSEVLHRARQILTNLEKSEIEVGKFSASKAKRKEYPAQLGLFTRKEELPDISCKCEVIIEALKKIDINRTTPLEALQYLNKLKSKCL